MINLKLITILVDIISADGRPEYQSTLSVYSDGFGRSVTIKEFVYINEDKEYVYIKVCICGHIKHTNSWDELEIILQVNGLILGDWAENETVSLTPLGIEQASLLSSIPYLFRENVKV